MPIRSHDTDISSIEGAEKINELYSQQFRQAIIDYSHQLSRQDQQGTENDFSRLSVQELGSIAGGVFIRWLSESTQPTAKTVAMAQSQLRNVFGNDRQARTFISGFLAEYYCHEALEQAGFEIEDTSSDQDVHFGVDLKVLMNGYDDFALDNGEGYGNVSLSIKHVAYYPPGEQLVWPCRTIEEFVDNLCVISQRYFYILTDSQSPSARQFASDILSQSATLRQLDSRGFIDSITQQEARQAINNAAKTRVEEMRTLLLRAYAQMHGLTIEVTPTKGGTSLTFKSKVGNGNKLVHGIQQVDPTTQAALVLMPGQNTTIKQLDGSTINTFVDFTVPSLLIDQFYQELANRPDYWDTKNRPIGGTQGIIRIR